MIRQTSCGACVIDGDTHHAKWVEEAGRLDHDRTIDLIAALLSPGDTVLDGGANIGTHTVAYLRAVGETGAVIAVEPNPDALACLRLNCPSAEIVAASLGHERGEALLQSCANAGASHLSSTGDVVCDVVTIDDILHGRAVRLIKLDVEGFEPDAIAGARETLIHHAPIIVLEVNSGALARYGWTPSMLLDFIAGLDYDFNPITGQFGGPQYDLLCLPN